MIEDSRFPGYLLTDGEIKGYLSNKANLVGIDSKDNFSNYVDKMKSQDLSFMVLNLDNKDGEGSHWVAMACDKGQWIYFDPFGVSPPESIINTCGELKYSTEMQQDINDASCGLFCIKWILSFKKKGRAP